MLEYQLRIENQTSPVGLDVTRPMLSWKVITQETNWIQEAFQIEVYFCKDGKEGEGVLIWDSKKCTGSQMSACYEGIELRSGMKYYFRVRSWKKGCESAEIPYSKPAFWRMGILHQNEWKAKWLGVSGDVNSNPVYEKKIHIKKPVENAIVYLCGLGHYEWSIDSKKVGDAVLQPGWTDYRKTCFYNTYDVTREVSIRSDHRISVCLGDGMYHTAAGQKGRYVYFERSFGRMKFLFQMHIQYQDGENELIISDESWEQRPGPITFSGIYGGEDYDARLEMENGGELNSCPAETATPPQGKLTAQKNPPLKVMERLKAVDVKKTASGYLYDFGQNFSGFVRMTASGDPGQEVIMIPGELLNENGEPDQSVTGKDYYWKYTFGNKREVNWQPRFTYYGFRYVLVKGAAPINDMIIKDRGSAANLLELTGEYIYPDIKKTGNFSCSIKLFNQIHHIIWQAMVSNMKSVLTDCPHREKFGWLEEAHLIGPALLFNYDLKNLYQKILEDMRDAQHDNGLVPDIAPEYITFGYHEGYVDSPEWGSAAILIPWYLYHKYGELRILEENYDTAVRYITYLTGRTHHYVLHHGLGDWCDVGVRAPFTQNTPVPVTATCMYGIDLRIMEQISKILGKHQQEEYYKNLYQQVKEEFNLQFFDDQTSHYATGSQTAQAMALMAGFVDKSYEEKVLEELVLNIRANQNGTTSGDVGHPYVLAALTRYGRSDVVYDMMKVTDRPGYGYQVKCGATTLAEEWDGPNVHHPHGSQNHFMLGSGDEWFYTGLGGICLVREENPVGKIKIQPYFPKDMEWLKVWHDHPYGKIEVSWRRINTKIELMITLPPNTSGEIILPVLSSDLVNRKSIENEGKAEDYGQHSKIYAGSGKWTFICEDQICTINQISAHNINEKYMNNL